MCGNPACAGYPVDAREYAQIWHFLEFRSLEGLYMLCDCVVIRMGQDTIHLDNV